MDANPLPESASKLARVEHCIERIRDPGGEGARVFTRVYDEAARLAARTADEMERLGLELPPLAGMPISIKDLFDVKGEPTVAGSRVLADAPPALRDAEIVRRLRQAGAAIVGKTNMTEFAFSGLGINPHYGTPLNVWDRAQGRIPGGSSSGAAISITDGMAQAAIGTDTGGSCRIPAAFNGIVGLKPSAQSVPMAGTLPLSASFDSIGPLAATVDMCAQVFAVLSGTAPRALRPVELGLLNIAVVKNYVLEGIDDVVGASFERALHQLTRAGMRLRDVSLPVLHELPSLFENGGVVAAEAFKWHRELIAARGDQYDSRVLVRIKRGSASSAVDYVALLERRRRLIELWVDQVEPFDALIMPTVPIVAPTLLELAEDQAYGRTNFLVLRNSTVVNAMDGCAISIPCHAKGAPPVGLTLACMNGQDHRLLTIAKAFETLLARRGELSS
jgi:aspartyl-tRNA(Asn)/glutamyl-tRNA(Gln) amidotransferase subunit A